MYEQIPSRITRESLVSHFSYHVAEDLMVPTYQLAEGINAVGYTWPTLTSTQSGGRPTKVCFDNVSLTWQYSSIAACH